MANMTSYSVIEQQECCIPIIDGGIAPFAALLSLLYLKFYGNVIAPLRPCFYEVIKPSCLSV